jgi:nucleoid-associated protein YgaU
LETVLPSEIPSSATTTEVIQPATPMLEPELAASPTPSMAESVAEVTAIAPGRIDAATTALVEATAPETMPASLQEQVILALQAQDLYEKFGLVVRQQGQMIQIEGSVPTIKTRFMIENCARKVEGVHFVDIGRLQLYQSYVVQPGDTLSKIAEKLYGNPAYQKDIAALNQIKSANQILVGQSLALPIIE